MANRVRVGDEVRWYANGRLGMSRPATIVRFTVEWQMTKVVLSVPSFTGKPAFEVTVPIREIEKETSK